MEEGTQSDILGTVTYKNEMFVLSIHLGSTLEELYTAIGKRWANVKLDSVMLVYYAPKERKRVSLLDDDDVKNMVRLHVCWKLNVVEMVAIERTERENDGVQSIPTNISREIVSYDNFSEGECELGLEEKSIESWRCCIKGEGQIFSGPDDFRRVVKNYSIATRRSFQFQKNEKNKIIVCCSDADCEWRIYASLHKGDQLFAIRTCNLVHTCGVSNLRTRGHPRADSHWVSSTIKDKLRDEPSYRPSTILKDIHRDYGLELPYKRAWLGKEIALEDIHGADRGSYDRLRWYCSAVRETNPGSIADCEIDPVENKFRRLFICFHACLVGFLSGCRPLIFLDGTHIKNKHKGCLLSAVSKDANDDLFTIAFVVVDAENDENWEWFCTKLRNSFDSSRLPVFRSFTFFTDRHSGLLKAIPMVFPDSHHAYCLRHLVDNFKKQVLRRYPLHNKKHWSSVFMKAAYSPKRQDFDMHINNILTAMPLAVDFIKDSQPHCWANSLFSGDRWGIINNNQAESWNSWVKAARFMPIVAMVDHIRKQIMTMMHDRREGATRFSGQLCPKPEKKIASCYSFSRNMKLFRSSEWRFEVVDVDKTCDVDLHNWTCSCME